MPELSKKLDDIVDWILSKQDSAEPEITNLKLQKILFYLEGCFMAVHNRPLFEEDFRAWEHGPVIPSVYSKYRTNGKKPLPGSNAKPKLEWLTADEKDTLNQAYAIFSQFSPWKLRELSHEEKPWINAYNKQVRSKIDKTETMKWFMSQYLGKK